MKKDKTKQEKSITAVLCICCSYVLVDHMAISAAVMLCSLDPRTNKVQIFDRSCQMKNRHRSSSIRKDQGTTDET